MDKRVLTCVLAGMLLLPACGGGNTSAPVSTPAGETETTAAETEPAPRANLPEGLDLKGAEFHCGSSQPGAGSLYYYYASEESGDVMNDALYHRKRAVEEDLNTVITYTWYRGGGTYANELIDLVKEQVLAGSTGIDQILTHVINGISVLSSGGFLENFDTLPYIDTTADWWNREQMDTLRLGKSTFWAVNDFMLPNPYLIYFSKDMVRDLGLENPYQLVYDGKWTLAKMTELASSVKADLNGDGAMDFKTDRFGLSCWEASKYISFMPAADVFITSRGADGKLTVDMNIEKAQHVCEVLANLTADGTNYLAVQKDTSTHLLLDSGRVLFFLDAISNISTLRDSEVDFGLLPYPKYDEAQADYRSLDWGGLMGVVAGADKEKAAAVIEDLAFRSREKVVPTYYEVLLGEKLVRDKDAAAMLELVSDTLCYEIGGNYFGQTNGFKDLFYTASTLAVQKKSADFASWYAEKKPAADKIIADYYTALAGVEK